MQIAREQSLRKRLPNELLAELCQNVRLEDLFGALQSLRTSSSILHCHLEKRVRRKQLLIANKYSRLIAFIRERLPKSGKFYFEVGFTFYQHIIFVRHTKRSPANKMHHKQMVEHVEFVDHPSGAAPMQLTHPDVVLVLRLISALVGQPCQLDFLFRYGGNDLVQFVRTMRRNIAMVRTSNHHFLQVQPALVHTDCLKMWINKTMDSGARQALAQWLFGETATENCGARKLWLKDCKLWPRCDNTVPLLMDELKQHFLADHRPRPFAVRIKCYPSLEQFKATNPSTGELLQLRKTDMDWMAKLLRRDRRSNYLLVRRPIAGRSDKFWEFNAKNGATKLIKVCCWNHEEWGMWCD